MFISDQVGDASQQNELAKTAACFVLQTKEHYKLSQNATQGIIQGVSCLMQASMQ